MKTTSFTKRPLVKLKNNENESTGKYLIASNDALLNGRFTNENDTTKQRGLNKMAADVR
jgi:hypothetical protein